MIPSENVTDEWITTRWGDYSVDELVRNGIGISFVGNDVEGGFIPGMMVIDNKDYTLPDINEVRSIVETVIDLGGFPSGAELQVAIVNKLGEQYLVNAGFIEV